MDQTQPTVVRTSSPFEVLALAQGTLGFEPRESLVLVALRPPRWRTGLVARVDLPSPADAASLAEVLAGHVAADGAGRCFVAVVTDTGGVPRARRPERRTQQRSGRRWTLPRTVLVEQVSRALTDLGITPEPWLVHRGRLYSYSCRKPCCPPEGLSMDRLHTTQVAAELVLEGRVLGLDRQQWDEALQAAVEPAGEDVLRAVDEALLAVTARRGRRGAAREALSLWRSVVTSDPAVESLTPADAATLLDALGRLPLRDALLGLVVPEALPPCPGDCHDDSCPRCWAADPDTDPDPDTDTDLSTHAGAAVRVLQLLAQRARPGRRAVPLGCAAFVLWSLGAAPPAGRLAEMALADDPSHSLSDLVLRGVELGVRPPAVDRRRGGGSPDQVPSM